MHEVKVCGVGRVRGLVVVGVRRLWVARRSLARVRRGGGGVGEEVRVEVSLERLDEGGEVGGLVRHFCLEVERSEDLDLEEVDLEEVDLERVDKRFEELKLGSTTGG